MPDISKMSKILTVNDLYASEIWAGQGRSPETVNASVTCVDHGAGNLL